MLNGALTPFRPHRRLVGVVAVVLVGTGVVHAATAAPKTGGSVPKYYSASAAPTLVPLPAADTQTVTIALTNCNPCGSATSTQPFGSARISFASAALDVSTAHVDRGWDIASVPAPAGNTILELTNSGIGTSLAVPPGETVRATINVVTGWTTAGEIDFTTQVKQSNDFSGSGNDFGRIGADPIVYLGSGPATHLEFVRQPSTIQASGQTAGTGTTPILTTCASVRALDAFGNVATSFAGTVALTPSDSALGLKFGGTTPVSATPTAGIVQFGKSADCSDGLSATKIGFGYTLTASSGTLGAGTSDPFDVLQFYAKCGASCGTPSFTGKNGTTASAQAQGTSTNTLTFDVGKHNWPYGTTTCNPDVGTTDLNPYRDAVTINLDAHSKIVTLLWSKQAVQWAINNGASQWRVCLEATYGFTAVGGTATAVGGPAPAPVFYVGALLACGNAALTATDPCLQKLNKAGGGQQQAVVFIPNVTGDPHMV